MLHTCFREGDGLAVFDVWESQVAFEALGSKLMPIVQELGVEIPPPQFVEMIAYEVAYRSRDPVPCCHTRAGALNFP